jgi:hypothetical protein
MFAFSLLGFTKERVCDALQVHGGRRVQESRPGVRGERLLALVHSKALLLQPS